MKRYVTVLDDKGLNDEDLDYIIGKVHELISQISYPGAMNEKNEKINKDVINYINDIIQDIEHLYDVDIYKPVKLLNEVD